ncbi:Hypothetical protein POVR1_LOCUS278 [uncultured virus]|nr:Hypothetical protein POVR1_LOCUS278 [uncultured virus]
MDEPEEDTASPFDVPEIFIQLLLHADRSDYQRLYQSYKDLMDSPYVLKQLQVHYHLPFQPQTFYDFIFERDLRDPVERMNLCLSPTKMFTHAIKLNDYSLIQNLLEAYDMESYLFGNQPTSAFFLAGSIGNPKILQLLIDHFAPRGRTGILRGLAYGSHNELFDLYYNVDYLPNPGVIEEGAARGGNLSLVLRFYSPNTRSKILYGASIENHQKIIGWVYDQAPPDREDAEQIFLGAIRGGYIKLAENLFNALRGGVSPSIWDIINNSVDSNDSEVLDWLLSSGLMKTPLLYDRMYNRALGSDEWVTIKDRIVKRLLERYEDLNSVDNFLGDPIFLQYENLRRGNLDPIKDRDLKGDLLRKFYLIYICDLIKFQTVPDIIEFARTKYGYEGDVPVALKKLYDEKWLKALKKSIKDDCLQLTKWIVDRFHPDHETLQKFTRRRIGCATEWIRKTFNL